MEGFLIRVPPQQEQQEPGSSSSSSSSSSNNVCYYVLGEGFLRGFASPQAAANFATNSDVDRPLEEYQLTCRHVQVEPLYSLRMFRLGLRDMSTRATGPPSLHAFDDDDEEEEDDSEEDKEEKNSSSSSSSSSEDDAELYLGLRRRSREAIQATRSLTHTVVFFAASKELVERWTCGLRNWNRHCFEEWDDAEDNVEATVDNEHLEQLARKQLLEAFQQRNPELGFASLDDDEEDQEEQVDQVQEHSVGKDLERVACNGLPWWQMGTNARGRVCIHPSSHSHSSSSASSSSTWR